MCTTRWCVVLLCWFAASLAAQTPEPKADEPRPIDFAALDRTVGKTPKLTDGA